MAEEVAIAQTGADVVVPRDQQEMPPEMPAEPIVQLAGSFINIDPVHGAVGTATIYDLPDGDRVLRFEDFRSKNGPDLHVYLSTEIPASTFASLGDNEVHLGALKGNVGNQNYEIPAEVDLSLYKSVVIGPQPTPPHQNTPPNRPTPPPRHPNNRQAPRRRRHSSTV